MVSMTGGDDLVSVDAVRLDVRAARRGGAAAGLNGGRVFQSGAAVGSILRQSVAEFSDLVKVHEASEYLTEMSL